MTASCVTGATGFVGGHVAQALVKRGDSVRVTYRDRERLGRLGALEAEEVRADVLDRGSMRRGAPRGGGALPHPGLAGPRAPAAPSGAEGPPPRGGVGGRPPGGAGPPRA